MLVLVAATILWNCGRKADNLGPASPVVADHGPSPFLEPDATTFRQYGGSASCRDCHEEAYALWETSNHGLAERPLDPRLDRSAFDPPRSFRHGSQESRLRLLSNDVYQVETPGLSGKAEPFDIERVIGHDPLRQFLVPFPGGRLQVLEASWDPRSNQWFNVYGQEDRKPGEWGHWTGRGMNWNHMCAGCHNTRLRKHYDAASDTYRTTMAERSVGCEACHGPLKAHDDWQAKYGKSGMKDPTVPKVPRRQILDDCGFCHARRGDLTGDFRPGDNFFDHHDLVIVDRSDIYYPDGQVRDEDYEYASFLSSRMHFRNVMCLDCHDPHSMKTRLPGNWLCIRCHNGSYTNAPVIDPVAHSHHRVFGFDTNGQALEFDLTAYQPKQIKETGGECVNCHMPQTVYMQRHWRHDHGFTIPDPQLTKEHGIPNACTRCHPDKSVDWSIEWVEKWYGQRMDRHTQRRARWLARARANDPAARDVLLEMVRREEVTYWRAAAIELLLPWMTDRGVGELVIGALEHPDPLVRSKAARALEPLVSPNSAAGRALRSALRDPIRAVRVNAAWSLRGELDPGTPAAAELRHSLEVNADQPGGQLQLGVLAYSRGDPQQAFTHFLKAVTWDPNSAPIRHELAVALSALNRPREAVEQLEIACRLDPQDAEYRYRLGLAWNEAGNLPNTITALSEATRLDPRHSRAWYNLGLARNAAGRPEAGLEDLRHAEAAAPNDPRIPYAMATMLRRLGQTEDAKAAAGRALRLDPGFRDARQFLEVIGQEP